MITYSAKAPRSKKPKEQSSVAVEAEAEPAGSVPQAVQRLPERLPTNVPSGYADQAIDVVYGIHTSKIVFGVETGNGHLRPVQIVVLPTSALLLLAGNVLRDLTSAPMVNETEQRLGSLISTMRQMAPAPAASVPEAPAAPAKPKRQASK
ncbi:hypothetical protein BH11PSE13_BH11PSE13_05020 [soil metagenome]